MLKHAISQTIILQQLYCRLDVTIEIETDAYGSETTWELRGSTGTLLASGGPYKNELTMGWNYCSNSRSYVLLTTTF